MNNIVFLNAAKLDFDAKLDFSSVTQLGTFTRYDSSDDAEVLARVQDHQVVITKEMPVGRNLISQFPPSVRLICEAGTGYNNIDIVAAREKGIDVCNVPSYSTEAVAQLAITFLLNLSASLPQQALMLERKNFDNFSKRLMVPHFELSGKTLGIIGYGRIGQAAGRLAQALGMKVLAYDSYQDQSLICDTLQYAELDELLAKSDAISLHCPLFEGTRGIINKDSIAKMKDGVLIINTSRGPLIKETDLIEALQQGKVAGAGLDVHDPEPPAPTNPLFNMDNVIMTPHIGWRRLESRQRLVTLTADNIAAFLKGAPTNVVNK